MLKSFKIMSKHGLQNKSCKNCIFLLPADVGSVKKQ